MSRQKVDSEMIVSIAASKLSGALPALDGSALTGISDIITGASDPVVSTNPSGGVGSVYLNTSDGEMFVCTDATAGANVWTNVGAGEGNISSYTPGSFGGQGGGTAYGYHSGGLYPQTTSVQGKYDYANDGDSTSVANLARTSAGGVGNQSSTAGYHYGYASFTSPPNPANMKLVQKHTFASNTCVEFVGAISLWSITSATATNSITHGYTIGGTQVANEGDIQKMSFATETTMTFVGDAYNGGGAGSIYQGSPHASLTHGYRAGGGSPAVSSIEKWAFATDANSAFVANMVRGSDMPAAGGSSDYNGYIMGGNGPGQNEYDKFSFSSDADSTTVGTLFHGEGYASGTSSLTHCYMAGGGHPQIDTIQKGSFATDGNMTDVGNIIQARAYLAGFQD